MIWLGCRFGCFGDLAVLDIWLCWVGLMCMYSWICLCWARDLVLFGDVVWLEIG